MHATLLLLALATWTQDLQPLPPEPNPPDSTTSPPPVKEGEPVTDAERTRIQAMLEKYAQQKLKGIAIDRRFRKRLMPLNDPSVEPLPDETSPHEVGFHAKLADSLPVKFTLDGAEVLGPRRYRLATRLLVPVESAGGFYKFDGNIPVIRRPIGWIVENINVDIEVVAILDVAWKTLESGNIGIYPGGFLDDTLTKEQQAKAPLFEDLRVDVKRMDLSKLDMDGINGKPMVRAGTGVGRGGLLRLLLGPGQREQIEAMIENGFNNAIRNNEPQILEGINTALQAELPKSQIEVTNFIEKLAIQANLPGKKEVKPSTTTPKAPPTASSTSKKETGSGP
jgi:hypothetical protein